MVTYIILQGDRGDPGQSGSKGDKGSKVRMEWKTVSSQVTDIFVPLRATEDHEALMEEMVSWELL